MDKQFDARAITQRQGSRGDSTSRAGRANAAEADENSDGVEDEVDEGHTPPGAPLHIYPSARLHVALSFDLHLCICASLSTCISHHILRHCTLPQSDGVEEEEAPHPH